MKNVFLATMAVVFLSACELQQDPLKDATDPVRNGQIPDTQVVEKPRPWPKEALVLEAPKTIHGIIDRPLDFEVRGRVNLPENVPFTIVVKNLNEFPGASFDSATGLFRWTPSKAYLKGDQMMVLRVFFAMITEPTEHQPSTIEEEVVAIVLTNVYDRPTIHSIRGPGSVVGGSLQTLNFTLDDMDAQDAIDIKLVPQSCVNSYLKSLSHLASLKEYTVQKDPQVPGRFHGEISLDLRGTYGLRDDHYCVSFIAVSKFGMVSVPYSHTFMLEPRIAPTVRSMEATTELKIGETVQFVFNIYDETKMSEVFLVSITDLSDKLPGSRFHCVRVGYDVTKLECTARIETAQAVPGIYYYDIVVKSRMTRTNQERVDSHRFRVRVR